MVENPLETEQANRLDTLTTAPKVVGAVDKDADLATSVRTGEDPRMIAEKIDGLEYHSTEDVGIGRLAQFEIVDE